MMYGRRVRSSAFLASLLLAISACGGSQPSSAGSSAPSATSTAGSTTGPLGSPAAGPTGDLPEPTLTDAAEINAALTDPARMAIGVTSLLAQLGIEIDTADGTILRPGSGEALRDLHLSEAEVRGLIDMGEADAKAILAGQVPWTLANLHDGLSSLIAGLTLDDMIGAYVTAYRAAPGDFVREVLNGHPLLSTTAFTRVQLWLLLVDGLLGRGPGASASARLVSTVERGPTAAAPVAVVQLPAVAAVFAGLDVRDIALLATHVMTLAYSFPMDFTITPANAHEGHGGPGPDVAIAVRYIVIGPGLVSPHSGQALLLPNAGTPAGVPIVFESADTSILAAHGTFPSLLGVPIMTDVFGVSRLPYQVREEPAGGRGQLMNGAATLVAVVDLREVIQSRYLVRNSAILAFAFGERRIPNVLFLEWHEETPTPSPGLPGEYRITLTGPRPGAGSYSGHADSLCASTVSGGRQFWTITGQPHDSGATLFDLQQNVSGFDTISVGTDSQTEVGPWYASSNTPGQTAVVTESGGGQSILLQGHGTITDTAGRLFTIDITASCAIVV